jgi:hypothetical protein
VPLTKTSKKARQQRHLHNDINLPEFDAPTQDTDQTGKVLGLAPTPCFDPAPDGSPLLWEL